MKQALAILVPLVTLGVLAGSFWYVGARLHALFGVASRRLLASAVAGGVVAAGIAMLGAARSASPGARYVAAKGVGLMLSGHTHAGQVFPITWIAGLVFPFNRGLHREGDSSIFVSQRAGTFVTRVRLGTSNELNLIRLQPGGRA